MNKEELKDIFTYHPPRRDQADKHKMIWTAGLLLAEAILDYTPSGADQACAIRHIRDACMTANVAIAIGEAPSVAQTLRDGVVICDGCGYEFTQKDPTVCPQCNRRVDRIELPGAASLGPPRIKCDMIEAASKSVIRLHGSMISYDTLMAKLADGAYYLTNYRPGEMAIFARSNGGGYGKIKGPLAEKLGPIHDLHNFRVHQERKAKIDLASTEESESLYRCVHCKKDFDSTKYFACPECNISRSVLQDSSPLKSDSLTHCMGCGRDFDEKAFSSCPNPTCPNYNSGVDEQGITLVSAERPDDS